MSYLDTNKLRHLVANGHNLAKETVLDLLTRVEHQQDRELRQLALDKHPIDPDTLKLANQHMWEPDQAYGFGNPIFSIIQQLTQSLSTYAHTHDLIVDPASIRIETHDTDGTNTTRLTATITPQEQS